MQHLIVNGRRLGPVEQYLGPNRGWTVEAIPDVVEGHCPVCGGRLVRPDVRLDPSAGLEPMVRCFACCWSWAAGRASPATVNWLNGYLQPYHARLGDPWAMRADDSWITAGCPVWAPRFSAFT